LFCVAVELGHSYYEGGWDIKWGNWWTGCRGEYLNRRV